MPFPNFGDLFSGVVTFVNDHMPWNWQKDPEWLTSLLGDSPLLERSEYEFLSRVRRSIIEEARTRPNGGPNRPNDLPNKLSVLRDNFDEVVIQLRQNSWRKNYFLENYPSWHRYRDLSILQLIDIAKAVKNNSKESAGTRCLGSTVSLAGGLLCLVPGLGALRLAGGVLVGLGSLAAAGASFLEFQVLQQKIKEAEKVMLKDKHYSEEMWSWMSDMSHVQEAYDIIKSIKVGGNLKEIAKDLYDCFKTKSAPEQQMMTIVKIVTMLKFPHGIIDDIADVIGILLTIFMLYDRYRPLFNIAFETYKCKRALNTAYDVAYGAVKMASVVNAGNSKLNPFQKFRFGIGIALDVISIIHAAKDLEETSKEAIAIAEAAKKLKEEAEVFKKLYDKLVFTEE